MAKLDIGVGQKLDIGVLATVGALYRNHINCIWGVFGRDLLVRGAQRMVPSVIGKTPRSGIESFPTRRGEPSSLTSIESFSTSVPSYSVPPLLQ